MYIRIKCSYSRSRGPGSSGRGFFLSFFLSCSYAVLFFLAFFTNQSVNASWLWIGWPFAARQIFQSQTSHLFKIALFTDGLTEVQTIASSVIPQRKLCAFVISFLLFSIEWNHLHELLVDLLLTLWEKREKAFQKTRVNAVAIRLLVFDV